MQLYRIGGNKFVLIVVKHSGDEIKVIMEKAGANLGGIDNIPISFQY